jgi:hypothetical protein
VRRAFTLVEAAVFGALGVIVLIGLFTIFRSTNREAAKTSVHLRGIQAALALVERLSFDLRAGMAYENPYLREGWNALVVPAAEDGRVVEFWRFDPQNAQPMPPDPGGTLAFVPVQQVRYRFDPQSRRVTRTVGQGRPETITVAQYLKVEFQAVDNLLRVTIQWVPEERARMPVRERGEVMTAVVSLGRDAERIRMQHPGRVFNPTSFFQPERIGP